MFSLSQGFFFSFQFCSWFGSWAAPGPAGAIGVGAGAWEVQVMLDQKIRESSRVEKLSRLIEPNH